MACVTSTLFVASGSGATAVGGPAGLLFEAAGWHFFDLPAF